MSGFMAAVFQPIRYLRQGFHSISAISSGASLVQPETSSLSLIRTKVRYHFPRPNEVKRVRRHGWETRMATNNGRKIIMRRLLKGRFVLSH